MFFKKPKPPLDYAVDFVEQAAEMAAKYLRDRAYQPTSETLGHLDALEKAMFRCYASVSYVNRCLGQRSRGQPEGSPKWSNPDVFDYHYPEK